MKTVNERDEWEPLLREAERSAVCISGTHCPHCRAYAPTFRRAAEGDRPGWQFAVVDADSAGELAASLGVRAIPTTLFFRGETEVARRVGNLTPDALEDALRACEQMP